MLTRRHFIATSTAISAFGISSASAAEPVDNLIPHEVKLRTRLPAGEIHLDPNQFGLYWTLPDNRAIRYAVGIGRPGLYEPGTFYVGAKKEWPSWTPTADMIKRSPSHYAKYKDGMPGGPNNPLGARALYLFVEGKGDTFLRIHGTNKPNTIATRVSNGCARLTNEYIVDLYNRVPIGTKVTLYPTSS